MTSAAKPKRRPPLTTFATRLMPTSFSVNSLSSRSRGWRSPSPLRPCVRAIGSLSEIEPALAGGVRQCLVRTFALHRALLLLAFLAANGFVTVLDPLALVGLGRAERAELGGALADPLAIGAVHGDRRRPLAVDPHILRDRIGDLVAVAE